jgi:hypothetical protein
MPLNGLRFPSYWACRNQRQPIPGSSANLLAVAALSNPAIKQRLRPGDEVIVPAYAGRPVQAGLRLYEHRVVGDLHHASRVMRRGFAFGNHQGIDPRRAATSFSRSRSSSRVAVLNDGRAHHNALSGICTPLESVTVPVFHFLIAR